jgi:hypothetical protein
MKYFIAIVSVSLIVACGPTRQKVKSDLGAEQYEFSTNLNGEGPTLIIDLKQGESFYYPLMAIWLEDMEGGYIQTLYVARSVATGVFKFGQEQGKKWAEAPKRAPQTLPYWAHKRGVKASDGLYMPEPSAPVADAYTGATPVTGFVLKSKADNELSGSFRVLLEINQNWDWNRYWTNDKFPGDVNYSYSAQPALVYEAVVDGSSSEGVYLMKPIGHSHYSGKTGELFSDLSTLSTALSIASTITVTAGK